MAAIPKRLLIHSATHKILGSINAFGEQTVTETPLKHVRFEPARKTFLSNLGEAKSDKYLMFYDIQNSSPANHSFNKLDKIVFNGVELTIREIVEEYDARGLHHLEINLN